MGNVFGRSRHESLQHHPSPPQTQSYPNQYRNPNHPPLHYYQYQGFYGPPPPSTHHHQEAVKRRNDINLKKETLRFEPDEENPDKFLVSFTFDAYVSGSITVMFFAKEDDEFNLKATKEDQFPSSTFSFTKGVGQKFKQPCGAGIEFSAFSEEELVEASEADVYHVAVKVEAAEVNLESNTQNCQITLAVLEKDKDKDEYKARVAKQILWVNGIRYDLQEIYGIGDTVDGNGEEDGIETGKECVICLTEPRDTTVFPCRHMCMCSGCAKVLRFQTNLCPICREPVEKLLEIKLNTNVANQ